MWTAIAVIAISGVVLSLALVALASERRASKAESESARLDEQLHAANAATAAQTARADFQERRANALDDAIAEHAADGGAAGANDRLLAQWRAARAADGAGADELPDAEDPGGPAAPTGPDDLMRPGD